MHLPACTQPICALEAGLQEAAQALSAGLQYPMTLGQLSKQVLSHLGELHSHAIADGLGACIIGCQADCQQACGVHSARLEQLCRCRWICVAASHPAQGGETHEVQKSCKDGDQIHSSKDTVCGEEQTASAAHASLSWLLQHAWSFTWAEVLLGMFWGRGADLLVEAGVVAHSWSRGRKSSSVSGNWACQVLALW